ncbi:MAG: response regulator transcription factor [Culicoidibacterales bacterium]
MNILLLEDEKIIRDVILEYMHESGFDADCASNAKEALMYLETRPYDVAILDIMLPGEQSGLDVLKWIRSQNMQIPVIMLSALSDEKTQVEAFDYTADDYVTKPFSPQLLLKRMEAAIRRYRTLSNITTDTYGKDGLELVEDAYQFFYRGKSLELTLTEFLILNTLYQNQKMIFTRDHLLDVIYREDEFPNDRIIDAHIKNIRKKLPIDVIHTCKGIGYRYEVKQG